MTEPDRDPDGFSRRSESGPPFRIMGGVIVFILVMIAVVPKSGSGIIKIIKAKAGYRQTKMTLIL